MVVLGILHFYATMRSLMKRIGKNLWAVFDKKNANTLQMQMAWHMPMYLDSLHKVKAKNMKRTKHEYMNMHNVV